MAQIQSPGYRYTGLAHNRPSINVYGINKQLHVWSQRATRVFWCLFWISHTGQNFPQISTLTGGATQLKDSCPSQSFWPPCISPHQARDSLLMAPPSRFTALSGFDFGGMKVWIVWLCSAIEAYLSDPHCFPALTPLAYLQPQVFDLCDTSNTFPEPTGMRKLAQKVKRDLRLACPALMNTASDIRQPGLPLTISKGLLFAPLTLPIQPDFFHSLGNPVTGFQTCPVQLCVHIILRSSFLLFPVH